MDFNIFVELKITKISGKWQNNVITDFKQIPRNGVIKNKSVHDFDKTFLFSSYKYFCRSTEQKIVGKSLFFVIKPKRKLFCKIGDMTF